MRTMESIFNFQICNFWRFYCKWISINFDTGLNKAQCRSDCSIASYITSQPEIISSGCWNTLFSRKYRSIACLFCAELTFRTEYITRTGKINFRIHQTLRIRYSEWKFINNKRTSISDSFNGNLKHFFIQRTTQKFTFFINRCRLHCTTAQRFQRIRTHLYLPTVIDYVSRSVKSDCQRTVFCLRDNRFR